MGTGRVQLTSMSKHPENHIVWFSPLDYGNSIKKKRNSFQRVEKPQFQYAGAYCRGDDFGADVATADLRILDGCCFRCNYLLLRAEIVYC